MFCSRCGKENPDDAQYCQEWESVWPINYFIFAYDSINPEKLLKRIESIHRKENLPPHSRIDTVCILNKGVISNESVTGQIEGLPDSESKLVYVESEISLLFFYALITRYLNQTRPIPDFNFIKYLSGIKSFGKIVRLK